MKNELITLYRNYNLAMAADNVDQLDQLLAPQFTLTHMTGYVQPRAEWLGEIKTGQMAYFDSQEDQIEVVKVGDGWRLTGQSRVTASIHGSARHAWPLRTVMSIQRLAGRLQIMTAIVTTY
ncbi:nuclear transport factor 2 family protein [Lactiplantibacillus nangangensis]|uniref:Nuclear transport factor 2 family protein n=1 Tax=Lactiplantibacillus nangangensis TaxID=2559917 RepID=A0ABW1SKB3_9LACO|nr:nuclear transport factor 2 family protein [Lactiplantibacillus nangangensis]